MLPNATPAATQPQLHSPNCLQAVSSTILSPVAWRKNDCRTAVHMTRKTTPPPGADFPRRRFSPETRRPLTTKKLLWKEKSRRGVCIDRRVASVGGYNRHSCCRENRRRNLPCYLEL